MPKIDFYILSNDSEQLHFVCRLIEKDYKKQHRIFIHTDTIQMAHQVDELLWTYRDDSFLPHNLYGEGPTPAPPIQIGCNTVPQHHHDILINLSLEVPAFYQQFNRILEIVPHTIDHKNQARAHYKFYRNAGLTIETHSLTTEV